MAPFQLAKPLFAQPQFTAALLIGFGLAGRRHIDCLAGHTHRRRHNVSHGAGYASRQGQQA
jgi:hypothetical protein